MIFLAMADKQTGRLRRLKCGWVAACAGISMLILFVPAAVAGTRPTIDWSIAFNPNSSADDLGAVAYSRTEPGVVYFAGNGFANKNVTPPPEGVPKYPYTKLLPDGVQFDFFFQTGGVYVGKMNVETNTIEFFSFVLFGASASSTLKVTDMAVDNDGNIYVVGNTRHFIEQVGDFPVTNRFAGCRNPSFDSGYGQDSFIVKVSPDGEQLLLACYYGGSGDDDIRSIDILAQNEFVISGYTSSSDLVISAPVQTTLNGPQDGYIAVHLPNGALYRSAYFGGSGSDAFLGVKSISGNRLLAVGITDSTDLPVTTDAYQTSSAGALDAVVVTFESPDLGVDFASYFGGSGNDSFQDTDTDSSGNIYVVGTSNSIDYPTFGVNASAPVATAGAVVTKFSSNLQQLRFSTFNGLDRADFWSGEAIGVSASGDIAIGGSADQSLFFPMTNRLTALDDPAYVPSSFEDGYVIKWLNGANGYELDYQTLIGSRGNVNTLAFRDRGEILVSGWVVANPYIDDTYHDQVLSQAGLSFGPFAMILSNDVPSATPAGPGPGNVMGGGGGSASWLVLALLFVALMRAKIRRISGQQKKAEPSPVLPFVERR